MSKKEFWVSGEIHVELYKSTTRIGNRYSLAGRDTSYRLRGYSFGINDFASKEAARAFLQSKGFSLANHEPLPETAASDATAHATS